MQISEIIKLPKEMPSDKPKSNWWWYSYARWLVKQKGYDKEEVRQAIHKMRALDRKNKSE